MWARTPTTIKENIYEDIRVEQRQKRKQNDGNCINNTSD